jgi:NADPH-dependent ferric siderophore reductase
MSEKQRAPKPQTLLHVTRTERLTAHMVRVWLGGPGFADFLPNGHTDMYVKLIFNPDGTVPDAPFDLVGARATLPREQVPVTRTYTVRLIDAMAGELALDFVVHGDAGDPGSGIAAPWAQRAQPGDRLLLQGPGGAYSPFPDADTHLLVGDESAIPAIASALEALPPTARGLVVIEVNDDADHVTLNRPQGMELHWVHRFADGHSPARLRGALEEVLNGEWPTGVVDVFAHGEREAVKTLRGLFREREVPRERLSISAYWAEGRTEDAFQAEKKTPIGKID